MPDDWAPIVKFSPRNRLSELMAQQQPQAELRAYNPTLAERMKYTLASMLGDDREAMRHAEKIMDVANMTPLGIPLTAYDAGRALGGAAQSAGAGDIPMAAMTGAGGLAQLAMSVIPGARVEARTAIEATDQLRQAIKTVDSHQSVLVDLMKSLGFNLRNESQSGKSEARYLKFNTDTPGPAIPEASKKGKSLFVQEFPGGHPFDLSMNGGNLTVRIAGHSNHGASTNLPPNIQWSINRTPEENAEFVKRYIERAQELSTIYPRGGQ